MYQNAFGGRALPGPAGGAHSARSPDPLALFGGGAAPGKGRGMGRGKGRENRRGEGEKGGGREMGKRGEGGGEGRRREGSVPLQLLPVPSYFLIPGVAPDLSTHSPDQNHEMHETWSVDSQENY